MIVATNRRMHEAPTLLCVLVSALVLATCCLGRQGELANKLPGEPADWWSPMTFKEYQQWKDPLLSPDRYRGSPSDAGRLDPVSIRGDADRWVDALRRTLGLSDDQAAKLKALVYDRKLANAAYMVALQHYERYMSRPMATQYDEAQTEALLNRYFLSRAYQSVQDARFWREFESVRTDGGKKPDAPARSWYVRNVSWSLTADNTPGGAGPYRIEERVKYAKSLTSDPAREQIENIYVEAMKQIRRLDERLKPLRAQLDKLEQASELDERAMREIALEGVKLQVQIGLIAYKALWDMLKLVPEEYQGTWARLPGGMPLPDKAEAKK